MYIKQTEQGIWSIFEIKEFSISSILYIYTDLMSPFFASYDWAIDQVQYSCDELSSFASTRCDTRLDFYTRLLFVTDYRPK